MNIQASELRIGNWVNNDIMIPKAKAMQVYPMMIAQLASKEKVGEKTSIEPIPLTEEWILNFGFVKPMEEYIHYNKTQGVWTYSIQNHPSFTEGYLLFIDVDDVAAPPSIKIKYVHQLQNLYFALTGEELTLK